MSVDRHCIDCCFFRVSVSSAHIYLQECQVNQNTKKVHSYDSCVDFMPRTPWYRLQDQSNSNFSKPGAAVSAHSSKGVKNA